MAYCRKCGFQIPDDSIFCPQCGVRIETNNVNETQENRNFANENHDLKYRNGICRRRNLLDGK